MNVPKTHGKGFSIRIFIAFIFIFLGVIVLLELFNIKFIKDDLIISSTLKYGTALGSLIGGIFMMLRKKEKAVSDIKI